MGVCESGRGVRELYQISDQVNPQLVTIRIRTGVVVHMCITAGSGDWEYLIWKLCCRHSSAQLPRAPREPNRPLAPSKWDTSLTDPFSTSTRQEGGLNVHPQPSKMWDFTAPEGTRAAALGQSKAGVPGAGGLLQARQQKQQMLSTSPFLTSSEPKISAQR